MPALEVKFVQVLLRHGDQHDTADFLHTLAPTVNEDIVLLFLERSEKRGGEGLSTTAHPSEQQT